MSILGGDEYLTPGAVARLLHVSAQTVTRWAKEGRLPSVVTLGGHHRFKASDILPYTSPRAESPEDAEGGAAG
jgi:excisionase family DNA binding protein